MGGQGGCHHPTKGERGHQRGRGSGQLGKPEASRLYAKDLDDGLEGPEDMAPLLSSEYLEPMVEKVVIRVPPVMGLSGRCGGRFPGDLACGTDLRS